MLLYQVLAILATHFVGDFVLQTHWMAQNKSRDNEALLVHVLVYTICLCFGAAGAFLLTGNHLAVMAWIGLNFALHFATDWVTSRWTSKLWAAQRWHDFFVAVGLDQLIHYVTLLLTARLLSLF